MYDNDLSRPNVDGENDEVKRIVEWFFQNYERPEENTPRDDGDWVWIHGGPYDADWEIRAHFTESSEADLARAIELIEEMGVGEWAGVPGLDEEDAELYGDPEDHIEETI